MAKLAPYSDNAEENGFLFECPGCHCCHSLRVNGVGPKWQFDGNLDAPTFSPSLLATVPNATGSMVARCHSFIRGGKIEFLSDCTHALAGQTVEIPEWE